MFGCYFEKWAKGVAEMSITSRQQEILNLLNNEELRLKQIEGLKEAEKLLGSSHCVYKVADIISKELE